MAAFVIGVVIGPVHIPVSEIIYYVAGKSVSSDTSSTNQLIISRIRLPRVLLGLLVGFALATCGSTMQGLFRNPLASPYILGVASGAAAGAAVVILLGLPPTLFLPLGAFLGGIAATSVVYRLAQAPGGKTSTYTLILAGVAIGALFSAITSFTIFLSSGSQKMSDVVFWIMGSLSRANWDHLYTLTPIVLIGSFVLIYFSRDLNALALGENTAFHLGLNPERTKRFLLVIATLVASSAVAFAGTIGFVGLITPHIMRLLIGPDHRYLLPASALGGAILLVVADVAARTVIAPAELPVGIITAFLGAPFFLYLLKTRKEIM